MIPCPLVLKKAASVLAFTGSRFYNNLLAFLEIACIQFPEMQEAIDSAF